MNTSVHHDGLAFRLCLYFTVNRGAAFFTGEICERWHVKRHLLWDRLAAARENGWLAAQAVEGEKQFLISAGPKLEEAIQEMTCSV